MAAAIAYGSQGSATISSLVATIAGLSFGSESSDRIVLAAIGFDIAATISSVTIGGVSAGSPLVADVNSNRKVAIYGASLPTGTTGDVVVTMSAGNGNTVSAAAYALTGADATPTDTDSVSSTADVISITALTIPTDGVGLASSIRNTSSNTVTWTGASEDHDNTAGGCQHSSAHITTVGTNTISTDALISDPTVLVGVAFGPAAGGAATSAPIFSRPPRFMRRRAA